MAKQAERYIPNDPVLAESWPRMSRVVNIHTDPEGADVYVKPYETPDGKWQYLGRSPLLKTQIPLAFLRWKLQIAGYKDFEGTLPDEQWLSLQVTPNSPVEIMFALIKSGSAQAGMVRIPGGKFSPDITGLDYLPDVQLQDFWIDQHEVTNEEYKKFVAAGGYTNPRYWKVPFVKDNKTLSWEEALQLFLDKTGRPGPATWELGEYPEGQGNYPVVGVSWFEAAAYAEFVGKSLPSVYHWNRAAATWATNWIAPLSNFSGRGPSPANAYPGLGPYGTYDMAGNAKEWCWNSSGDNRYILGGAWDEVVYMFVEPDAQSPFRRAPNYGFRLAKYDSQPDKLSLAPLEPARRDFTKEKPIPAALFAIYRTVYTYDKTPMDPVVEVTDDTSPFWTQQKVTINAAYGNERYSLLVFLPKHGRPPYQTVVYFPGSNAIDQRSSNGLRLHGTSALDLLIRSGRAVVVPVYKGIYERGDTLNSPYPQTTSLYRDHVIDWAKDLGRAVDYIQTRSDLDHEKLAYYGFSWGGAIAPVMLSIETRFKAAVLLSGGFHFQRSLPEVDEFNFAPYVTVPTLMINGRYDFIFPVGLSQNPMFQSLGTAANYKRHVVLDTGHLPPREITAKETLDWLDHYLGPVKQATPQN